MLLITILILLIILPATLIFILHLEVQHQQSSRRFNGIGYINYTAHGDVTNWSNPSFTISNVNSLQNTNKYCFTVGNCCLTNKFDTAVCFGEAWLRANIKGAVVYIGGTNLPYWDEDYYWV
jgi:hypothetical protein